MKSAPLDPAVPAAQALIGQLDDALTLQLPNVPFRGRGVSKAIGLYRRLGYRERGPFGRHRPDPLCVFMEKNFSPRA